MENLEVLEYANIGLVKPRPILEKSVLALYILVLAFNDEIIDVAVLPVVSQICSS